jgi:peptide chain release factor 1
MLDKLLEIKKKRDSIQEELNDPNVISDMKRYIKLSKEFKDLLPLYDVYHSYKSVIDNIASAKDILRNDKDEEMRQYAKEELEQLEKEKIRLEEEIKILLLPSDPQDSKNAILEIRAGTGGDEASLFAGDLLRMYTKFAETKSWKMELVSAAEGTVGGFKEIILNITGEKVFGTLKYESGVHRVQRVPDTETQGRVHTSAASVVVLPEADEFDVDLKESDIRKDTYCSSGPGGQSVNTTYSAIRLTHIPTGIVVTCQDQKSQIKNYEKAFTVLRTRIYEMEYKKYLDKISSSRKTMVSTGDRSAKIRTYNYPQGRMTDHRIGLTLYNLSSILDGDIQHIIDALQVAENAERLKEATV